MYPIGYVAAGFLIKAYGADATFAVGAVVSAFVVIWAIFTPSMRGMNEKPAATGEASH